MDLKVLFHNPETLTDRELQHLRTKLRIQRSLPYYCGFFGAFAANVIEVNVLKRSRNWAIIAGAGLASFAIGGYGAYRVQNVLPRNFDMDIMAAHDKRYANRVLNATGFGTNYVSIHNLQEDTIGRKPY